MKAMDQNMFESRIQESKPVLVEFWAPWCVYCRRIAPAMEKAAQQWEEQMDFFQVNIDDYEALSIREQIELVPTMVIYKNGQALGSIVAPDSKAKIDEFVKAHLG